MMKERKKIHPSCRSRLGQDVRGCLHLPLSLKPVSIVCTSSHTIGEQPCCCQPAPFALNLISHGLLSDGASPPQTVSSLRLTWPCNSLWLALQQTPPRFCPKQPAWTMNIISVTTESREKYGKRRKSATHTKIHTWKWLKRSQTNKITKKPTPENL